jgi:hypothetical protein
MNIESSYSHGIKTDEEELLIRAQRPFVALALLSPHHWVIKGLINNPFLTPTTVDLFDEIANDSVAWMIRQHKMKMQDSTISKLRNMNNGILLVDGIAWCGKLSLMEDIINLLAAYRRKSLIITTKSKKHVASLAQGIFKSNPSLVVVHLEPRKQKALYPL